jgi:hypothetical protein
VKNFYKCDAVQNVSGGRGGGGGGGGDVVSAVTLTVDIKVKFQFLFPVPHKTAVFYLCLYCGSISIF